MDMFTLLRAVFGDEINVEVEKMKTLGLLSLLNEVRLPNKQKYKFDFISLPLLLVRKALTTFRVSLKMPNHIFVIPENISSEINVPENIIFRPCTWQTGLKQLIIGQNCSVFI